MDELERMTRRLALDIIARRAKLDTEVELRRAARVRGLKGRALPGRGNAQVTADRHVADGMVLGLSYLLGQPGETKAMSGGAFHRKRYGSRGPVTVNVYNAIADPALEDQQDELERLRARIAELEAGQ